MPEGACLITPEKNTEALQAMGWHRKLLPGLAELCPSVSHTRGHVCSFMVWG